jgi:hypothetical protein
VTPACPSLGLPSHLEHPSSVEVKDRGGSSVLAVEPSAENPLIPVSGACEVAHDQNVSQLRYG